MPALANEEHPVFVQRYQTAKQAHPTMTNQPMSLLLTYIYISTILHSIIALWLLNTH